MYTSDYYHIHQYINNLFEFLIYIAFYALICGMIFLNLCRCWFEKDEEFDVRCQDELKAATARLKVAAPAGRGQKKKAGAARGGSKPTSSAAGGSSWSTKNSRTTVGSGVQSGGGSRMVKPSGGFAAAFGSDSDSDSDA